MATRTRTTRPIHSQRRRFTGWSGSSRDALRCSKAVPTSPLWASKDEPRLSLRRPVSRSSCWDIPYPRYSTRGLRSFSTGTQIHYAQIVRTEVRCGVSGYLCLEQSHFVRCILSIDSSSAPEPGPRHPPSCLICLCCVKSPKLSCCPYSSPCLVRLPQSAAERPDS